MGPAASFNVHSLYIYDSDNIAWDDASLVKVKAELFLSFTLIFKVFINFMSLKNYFVGFIFDLHLDLLAYRFIMGDI